MADPEFLLIGCGILKKEVTALIKKNHWPVETYFLDTDLHGSFDKMELALTRVLEEHRERNILLFYGACHPLMHQILEGRNVRQIRSQNCIEMLMGQKRMQEELQKGAYFLLERWSLYWDKISIEYSGNPDLMKEIFHGDRKYILCVHTPTSKNFTKEAENFAKKVELPIFETQVTLEHLEKVISGVMTERGWKADV